MYQCTGLAWCDVAGTCAWGREPRQFYQHSTANNAFFFIAQVHVLIRPPRYACPGTSTEHAIPIKLCQCKKNQHPHLVAAIGHVCHADFSDCWPYFCSNWSLAAKTASLLLISVKTSNQSHGKSIRTKRRPKDNKLRRHQCHCGHQSNEN